MFLSRDVYMEVAMCIRLTVKNQLHLPFDSEAVAEQKSLMMAGIFEKALDDALHLLKSAHDQQFKGMIADMAKIQN